MTRKNARAKRYVCGNKQRFENYGEARYAAKSVLRRRNDKDAVIAVYRCKFCGFFHWGNRRRPRPGA